MCFCKKKWLILRNIKPAFWCDIVRYHQGIEWFCLKISGRCTVTMTSHITYARAQPSTNSWIRTINSSHMGVDMNKIEVAFSWKIIEEFHCYFNHMTLLAYWFEKYTLEVTAIFSSVFAFSATVLFHCSNIKDFKLFLF